MSQSFDELCRQATKGDKDAQTRLFDLAEMQFGKERFKDAASTFREAAIAYRIAAARHKAHGDEAAGSAAWLRRVIEIAQRWIETNPAGLRPLPQRVLGVDDEAVREIVIGELLYDEYFGSVFGYLEGQFESLGMEISSPGASVQRVVWMLVEEWFGLRTTPWGRFLGDVRVRVGIDQIADEVLTRIPARLSGR